MTLAHPDLTRQLSTQEYEVAEWIIESPDSFSRYIEEMQRQIEGQDGGFVLSFNDKEVSIPKHVEMIINPLMVDVNDKKILARIYSELVNLANGEEMYLKTREMVALLQQYFLELEYHYDSMLVTDDEFDLQGMFKTLGVKVETSSANCFEKILQYLKLVSGILSKKLIILVNIRSYLSPEKMEHLIQFAQYNEIQLLLIESMQRTFTDVTKKFIIDIDGCEI